MISSISSCIFDEHLIPCFLIFDPIQWYLFFLAYFAIPIVYIWSVGSNPLNIPINSEM